MSSAADLSRTFMFNDFFFRAGNEIEEARIDPAPSHPCQATINRLAEFPDRNQKLTRAVNCTVLGFETAEVGTPKEASVGLVSGTANWWRLNTFSTAFLRSDLRPFLRCSRI